MIRQLLYRAKKCVRLPLKWMGYNKEFYSCQYVQDGITFYYDNKVHTCCYNAPMHENKTICEVNDPLMAERIVKRKKEIYLQHRQGIDLGCQGCPCFRKAQWRQSGKITHVTLNHFLSCNLNCTHCGYMKLHAKDTKHEFVLNAVKELYNTGLIDCRTGFNIGGGEPSIQRGLDQIIEYILGHGNPIHINSNATNFVELYARGCLEGKIALTLTPDAGSREVYHAIKGADYFDIVWVNVSRYVQGTAGRVVVKIILEEGNLSDADNIVKMLVNANVTNVMLDLDLNVQDVDYPRYMPAIHRIKKGCADNGVTIASGCHMPPKIY